MRSLIVLLLLAATAAADSATPRSDITGFVTYGAGELSGTVTSVADGKPLPGVQVHILPNGAKEKIVTTDAKGVFRTKITGGEATYVFVEAKVKIIGQVASAVQEGEYEAIEIRETLPPVVQPRSKIPLDTVPDYSGTAQDKNQWTRAWLLLDVNEAGKVRRLKLMNARGLDLDAIAIREAFKLEFEPARDRSNKNVPALVVWSWEWPA